MSAMVVLFYLLPLAAAWTLIAAVGLFITLRPQNIWEHGRNIGLIMIAAGSLISALSIDPSIDRREFMHLCLLQFGLFSYSLSWVRSIYTCSRNRKSHPVHPHG